MSTAPASPASAPQRPPAPHRHPRWAHPRAAAPHRATRTAPRLPALLVLIVLGWALLLLAELTGDQHAAMATAAAPGAATLAKVALWWVLMTVAMMGPGVLAISRHLVMNTLHPAATLPCFLGTYLGIWVLSGSAATLTLSAVLAPAPATARPALIALAAVLTVAAGWQLTGVKRRCLRRCRGMSTPAAAGAGARAAALALGAHHGLACLGSCGPLMLVMLVAPGGHLALMVGLAALVWLEKARGLGRPLARPSALLLALAAAAALVLAALPAVSLPAAFLPAPMPM